MSKNILKVPGGTMSIFGMDVEYILNLFYQTGREAITGAFIYLTLLRMSLECSQIPRKP